MAIPKLKKQDVIDALKFIDENGVPKQNESTRYMLVGDNGKKYPPKYVVAVDPEEDLARLLPQKCKHLLPVGDAVGADDAAVGKYDASSRRGANRIA